MCEEFVWGGSAQMNLSAHAAHVVTVLSIFDATPPTSCLVSSSLCNEYSPQKPRLPWPLSATGGKFLSSINVERSVDRTAAAFSQTKKWSCEQITTISASQAWLWQAPDYSAFNFQLVLPRSLFTLSLRWWTPPPPPTPVWPFLLLCDWLEWTEDEAEEVLLRIQTPRTHQPPPLNDRPPVVFPAPILILSPCINRTDGAFSKLMWACATTATDSRILHRLTNDLTSRLFDAQLMSTLFQGCLVVFWPNQFSAVKSSTTTCLCMHALLGPGCHQVSRANPVFQIASKTSQLQNIARNGIVVLNCHKRWDQSQSLFYLVPQEKGQIQRPCWGRKNMGEFNFHHEDKQAQSKKHFNGWDYMPRVQEHLM